MSLKDKLERHKLTKCLALVISLSGLWSPMYAAEKRAMTPDDLFRLEAVGEVTLSPDANCVAYVLKRPKSTAFRFGWISLEGNDHADVWVACLNGGKPENITNGAIDGSGFWIPKWSPDGQWLAMVSSRGGNVRLWTWSKSSRDLRILSERAVNPGPGNFVWVSARELAFAGLAEGQRAEALIIDTQTPETAEREWAKDWRGLEPTVSVLESGIPVSMENRAKSQLLLEDVLTRKVKTVSVAPSFATLRLSPDHHSIAFLKQVGVWQPVPNLPVNEIHNRLYTLEVANLDGLSKVAAMSDVLEPFEDSILWSPDSMELAVIGYDQSSPSREAVYRCNITEQRCRRTAGVSLDLGLWRLNYVLGDPPYLWYGNRELLIHASVRRLHEDSSEPPKWWQMDEDGQVHSFFGDSKDIPSQLVPQFSGNGLVGIKNGKILTFNNDGTQAQDLTRTFNPKITSIERSQFQDGRTDERLLLGVQHAAQNDFYELNLRSDELSPISKPAPHANIAAYSAEGRTIVFSADDNTGTYLWLKRVGREGFTALLDRNKFLNEIGVGELKKIQYRSLDGQDLRAWIILPPAYQEGKRYPLIAWVYAGIVYGEEPPAYFCKLNSPSPFNLQLLAAHGYVVLMPSMPLKPYGQPADPYWELTKGVLPAVDKLVEIGIANDQELGVMGHSFGGYSTFGLITQTSRFKAAASMAGLSDLMSYYGTFDVRMRYQPFTHEDTFHMWGTEGYMGNPPWKDLSRYIRNSPISYADRVQTPLLIIHGDLDHVPIEQSEEFFTALYRQNKRAEFVRYWGEDHALDSPANIKDAWQRIYAWFDDHLKGNRSN